MSRTLEPSNAPHHSVTPAKKEAKALHEKIKKLPIKMSRLANAFKLTRGGIFFKLKEPNGEFKKKLRAELKKMAAELLQAASEI